jgi:hypothetical protein
MRKRTRTRSCGPPRQTLCVLFSSARPSFPALACSSIASCWNCAISSATHVQEKLFQWAFASLLIFSDPFPTVFSVLDASHCGQKETDDGNEIDGLNECPSSPFSRFPQSLTFYFGRRYRYMRLQDYPRRRESRLSSFVGCPILSARTRHFANTLLTRYPPNG